MRLFTDTWEASEKENAKDVRKPEANNLPGTYCIT
jgi:hypothetical protein